MMCRWVVAIGLVGLFFSCSSRKHMVAHYREESCKTVEAAFRDTHRQRYVEQEQEQTFWDIERVDSLEKVKNTESFLSDTCAVAGDVDKADERRTGGNVSWVLYLMLVVLGIVSIGLIVKR